MKIKLYALWERLSRSFWFLPSLMVLASFVFALGATAIDRATTLNSLPGLSWIYTGTPDGARSVLSVIAGSMISVAGVTFSITMVTLSLASTQLGPRLLNNFMRDRGNQVVLGTFISIFTYCLLVLRSVRSTEDATFAPHFSLTVGMLLALISLGVLIYFFHHVSTMIQVPNVVANIGHEMEESIDQLFSDELGSIIDEHELRNEDDIPSGFDDKSNFIKSTKSGYLQAIDYEQLLEVTQKNDLLLKLLYRPGDFVAKDSDIIAVYPATKLSQAIQEDMLDTFLFGAGRLHVQDIEFFIDQLVEISLRALSPSINDPFTVIGCLDQFSNTLSIIAERTIPSGYQYDSDEQLRIIRKVLTFDEIINNAFSQIRRYGRYDVEVTIRLLEVIAIILARTSSARQRQPLAQQAEMIKRGSEEVIFEENDRQEINKRYQIIMDELNNGD